jgi:hypothetical protein
MDAGRDIVNVCRVRMMIVLLGVTCSYIVAQGKDIANSRCPSREKGRGRETIRPPTARPVILFRIGGVENTPRNRSVSAAESEE